MDSSDEEPVNVTSLKRQIDLMRKKRAVDKSLSKEHSYEANYTHRPTCETVRASSSTVKEAIELRRYRCVSEEASTSCEPSGSEFKPSLADGDSSDSNWSSADEMTLVNHKLVESDGEWELPLAKLRELKNGSEERLQGDGLDMFANIVKDNTVLHELHLNENEITNFCAQLIGEDMDSVSPCDNRSPRDDLRGDKVCTSSIQEGNDGCFGSQDKANDTVLTELIEVKDGAMMPGKDAMAENSMNGYIWRENRTNDTIREERVTGEMSVLRREGMTDGMNVLSGERMIVGTSALSMRGEGMTDGISVLRGEGMTDEMGVLRGKGMTDGMNVLGEEGKTEGMSVLREEGMSVLREEGMSVLREERMTDGMGVLREDGMGVLREEGMTDGMSMLRGKGMTDGMGVLREEGMTDGMSMLRGIGMTDGMGVLREEGMTDGMSMLRGKGMTDGMGVLREEGMADGMSMLRGKGMTDGMGVLREEGMTDGMGVLREEGMTDGMGVLREEGMTDGMGVLREDGMTNGNSVLREEEITDGMSATGGEEITGMTTAPGEEGTTDGANGRQNSGRIIEEELGKGRRKSRPHARFQDRKRKELCNSGKQYVSKRGKEVEAKTIGKGCSEKCPKKCHSKISNDQRKELLNSFWQLGDAQKQWSYLALSVQEVAPTFRRTNSTNPKSATRVFTFNVNNSKEKVCKKFFLDTLDISEKKVTTALAKQNPHGLCRDDLRGKHDNRPRSLGNERDIIENHIRQFPKVPSHYCRQKTQRNYLDPTLSIQHMHRMYMEERRAAGVDRIGSLSLYKETFYTKFNLGFHKPKNDLCDRCSTFEKSIDKTHEAIAAHERHRQDVDDVRAYKNGLKTKAQECETFTAVTFDLEEVLQTPKAKESILYYKRKLNNYNLSIFDFKTGVGYNYLWNETIAKRGATDIASCVFSFICNQATKGIKSLALFSDSCGGQNRNQHFMAMLWYAVQNTAIEEIEHVFFVKGHSENESDGIHGRIERSSKDLEIYTTSQWATAIQTAKRTPPMYKVKEMSQDDFWDFKDVSRKFANTNMDTDRQQVRWLKIRKYCLSKADPNIIRVMNEIHGSHVDMNISHKVRRRSLDLVANFSLKRAYNKPIPLTPDKYKDLMELCDLGVITTPHHSFYSSLPVAGGPSQDEIHSELEDSDEDS